MNWRCQVSKAEGEVLEAAVQCDIQQGRQERRRADTGEWSERCSGITLTSSRTTWTTTSRFRSSWSSRSSSDTSPSGLWSFLCGKDGTSSRDSISVSSRWQLSDSEISYLWKGSITFWIFATLSLAYRLRESTGETVYSNRKLQYDVYRSGRNPVHPQDALLRKSHQGRSIRTGERGREDGPRAGSNEIC